MHSLLKSLTHLTAACHALETRCVAGITANREHLDAIVRDSIGLITALSPYIGYANSTAIARQAAATRQSIAELVVAAGLLSQEQFDAIIQPARLTRPRLASARVNSWHDPRAAFVLVGDQPPEAGRAPVSVEDRH